MNATFQDMQDDHNVKNGTCISDAASFDALICSFKGREPFCFLLTGGNGFTLTISWGPQVGSVQFGPSSGAPPYFMALAQEAVEEGEVTEFLAGGTPTPIPQRFCLPTDRVQKIVQDFLKDGTRSKDVTWEEI